MILRTRKQVNRVLNSFVTNPFVSEEQRRACYAANDPRWDCSEWEAKTKGKLPRRKGKRSRVTNAFRPLKVDPTRSITLRNAFCRELRVRFSGLRAAIINLVVDEDAFGIKADKADAKQLTANVRWRFHTSSEQVNAFQAWLKTQVQARILKSKQDELWRRYAAQGWLKGAGRAFDDARPNVRKAIEAAEQVSLDSFYRGTKAEFLRSAFGRPESIDKIKLLAGRTFDDLEGVTSQMSVKMSRALTDGLVQGKHPNEIADDLVEEVSISQGRAEVVARTEITRAHAEGQLDAMEDMGVESVGVAVEWLVTDDDHLCELCAALAGIVLKIDEARGLLPRHPL